MPRVPPQYPEAGINAIADSIRQRRGARGLTALDGTLLNAPEIAHGWNTLLGAIRTKTSLPGDLRELMILRVGARNNAAFEWIQHEIVGRDEGLTTEQLAVVRDTSRCGTANSSLSALHLAGLAFADSMTQTVKVPDAVYDKLRHELSKNLPQDVNVDQQMVEAAATVGTYNLVSRFLVALDVGDYASTTVPFPGIKREERRVPVKGNISLHVVTHVSNESAPWLLFINSLLTNLTLWDGVVARLSPSFNIVTFDQRGHGQSDTSSEPCTIDGLAEDVAEIVKSIGIPRPLRAVIGVSQGGATALATAVQHSGIAERFVICDTQSKSPATSKAAWDERIEHAKTNGMASLADITVKRWFPASSSYVQGDKQHVVREMIASTSVDGFTSGARALQNYDLSENLVAKLSGLKILLVAGELDGALPVGLKKLADDLASQGVNSRFEAIPGAGHLPMTDGLPAFLEVIEPFVS